MNKPLQQKKYNIKEHLSNVDKYDRFEGMSDEEISKYLDKIEQDQESSLTKQNKQLVGELI